MMEGICQEACSLAGHWGLGKLIAFYDDNQISIDGNTDITFTEDTMKRFEALGWHTVHVEDGNTDLDGIRAAIEAGHAETDRPTLIRLSTTIGYGSPKMAGTPAVHGSPIGAQEAQATRDALNWSYGEWQVPEEVYSVMRDSKIEMGRAMEEQRKKDVEAYRAKYPTEAAAIDLIEAGGLPDGWEQCLDIQFEAGDGDATRKHSNKVRIELAAFQDACAIAADAAAFVATVTWSCAPCCLCSTFCLLTNNSSGSLMCNTPVCMHAVCCGHWYACMLLVAGTLVCMHAIGCRHCTAGLYRCNNRPQHGPQAHSWAVVHRLKQPPDGSHAAAGDE
jgi:transketolase